MQDVKVVSTFADGSIAVTHLLTEGRGDSLPFGGEWIDQARGIWKREPTDANILAVLTKAFADREFPVSYKIVPEDQLPQDRTYRNAWTHHPEKGVIHDMAKARARHRDLLREARAGKLAALDADYMRADEAGDGAKKSDIAKAKQTLRDVTKHPDIEAAADVETLKTVTLGLL